MCRLWAVRRLGVVKRRRTLFLGGILLIMSGCTHIQLQKNTVRQARTLGDIHQQQVLNNLAMFAYDPNSLPSFSIPNQGSSNVTDTGSTAATPGFGRSAAGLFLFNTLGLSFGASRQAQEAFTLTPVNDPRKLELMRCAYQQAINQCGRGEVSEHCPDCKTILNKFYTGDPDGDIATKSGGVVTSECLKSPCWFHVGCKHCVPKQCPCSYVGEYCGVYVWVLPDGQNDLTKLTLAILDYALHDPPVMRTKQVVYYLDEYGLPTTQALAVGAVTATVNIDEKNASLLNLASKDEEARLEQVIKAQLQDINEKIAQLDKGTQLSEKSARDERKRLLAERDSLLNKLQYISEQFRTGALKEKYFPPAPSTAPGSLLLPFNLQQNALTPGRLGSM